MGKIGNQLCNYFQLCTEIYFQLCRYGSNIFLHEHSLKKKDMLCTFLSFFIVLKGINSVLLLLLLLFLYIYQS